MKARLFALTAVMLAASVFAPPLARAEGPRASSENNWRGMYDANLGMRAVAPAVPQTTAEAAPHYVWQEGYEHGGKWHGHWTLVR